MQGSGSGAVDARTTLGRAAEHWRGAVTISAWLFACLLWAAVAVPSIRPTLIAISAPVSLATGALWAFVRVTSEPRRGRGAERESARGAPPQRTGPTPSTPDIVSHEPSVQLLVVARGAGFDVVGSLTRVAAGVSAQRVAAEDDAVRLASEGDLAAAEQAARRVLDGEGTDHAAGARVDAWQALAMVRERRGEFAGAVEALQNAVRAAKADGLAERECSLQLNLGSLLATVGARAEARAALIAGVEIAHRTDDEQAVRRARVELLSWLVTFGTDEVVDAEVMPMRAIADRTVRGGWIETDRRALGLLYYRACELLLSADPLAADNATALFQMTVEASRTTGNAEYLPLALAAWARAEVARGDTQRAVSLAEQAGKLVDRAKPGRLDLVPVYLALHDSRAAAGDTDAAKAAVQAGLVVLSRRLCGVAGTPFARPFLKDLPHVAALLDLARRYGMRSVHLQETP